MHILVISDVHLTHKFDEKKYAFLEKIIKQADQVILNGDIWDGYLTSFNRFVKSEWKNLFPLLKKKKAVYIFGNHDKKGYSDERRQLFSDIQTYKYTVPWGKKTLVFEHGDRMLPLIDTFVPFRAVNKMLTMLSNSPPHQKYIKMAGTEKKHSEIIQKNLRKLPNTIYICGHAHYGVNNQDKQFVGSGSISNGEAAYIVISDTAIEVKKEKYG